uniref:Uncharacterized protein n=1 Tax=Arundo donax TaxID=35708 RepID=A0A0A9H2X9_ARUDO
MWKRATSLIQRHHRSALGPRFPAASAAAAAASLRRTPPRFFSTLGVAPIPFLIRSGRVPDLIGRLRLL